MMNLFLFLREYRYFHSLKDEILIQFGFTSLNRINISPRGISVSSRSETFNFFILLYNIKAPWKLNSVQFE